MPSRKLCNEGYHTNPAWLNVGANRPRIRHGDHVLWWEKHFHGCYNGPRRKRMEEKSQLTFRITLWRPWLLAVTPLALLAVLGVAIFVVGGELAAAAGILL